MKRLIAVAIVLVVGLSGCNGVQLNAQYKTLLSQTSALSDATVAKWDTLTPAQQKQAVTGQAQTWHKFLDASNGVATP